MAEKPSRRRVNAELNNINALYLSIEEYYVDIPERMEGKSAVELTAFSRHWNANWQTHTEINQRANQLLCDLLPHLSPSEINEGYRGGCTLLQHSLSGYMRTHFDEIFIDTMRDAIRNDHRPAYLFLNELRKHMGENFLPVLFEALDVQSIHTLQTAMGFVQEFKIEQALPKIQNLVNHPEPGINECAREVLESFKD